MIKCNQIYEYDESSIGDRSIPKYATTKTLKALGATLNFIDIWLKLFLDNYDARCDVYVNDTKDMFKQILQTMSQPITPKTIPDTYDIYWWWMVYGKSVKGLPPLRRPKLSKKSTRKSG